MSPTSLARTRIARTDDGWFVVHGERLTRIGTAATTTAALLADRDAIAAAVATPDLDGPMLAEVTLRSPVTMPARVVAQMVNYRSHAIDSGFDPDAVLPTFFRKSSSSVSGPNDPIVRPAHVTLLDYEIELGLVLGAPLPIGARVTPSTLADYVAALVVCNDVSARDVQLPQGQFYEGKSYPGFTPVGPWLVLVGPDELSALDRLRLHLAVDGETRQDAPLTDMLVGPCEALTRLARFQELAPGDLLLTGTPGGTALVSPPPLVVKLTGLLAPATRWRLFLKSQGKNPRYLQHGQIVTARIHDPVSGFDLGEQRNTVRFEPAA